jgi:hypothetical protein
MSEQIHIYIPTLALICLIFYSFIKWGLKGQIFHPALIYSCINGGFLIVFAFGPYFYAVEINVIYYYMYAFITIAFIVGIVLGEAGKTGKAVKDITLNRQQFFFLYFITLMPILLILIQLGISTKFNLEEAAAARLLSAAKSQNESNLVHYAFMSLIISFTQLLPTIFLTYGFKSKKYITIALWLSVILGVALLQNSRTLLIFNLFLLIIPYYTVIQTNYKKTYRKKYFYLKNILILIKNNMFKIVSILLILLILIVIQTNTRSQVRSETTVGAGNQTYQLVEQLYRAEKKQWFQSWLAQAPASSVDTVAELSLYAGGTVASGGVIARIATDTGLYTWGLRNFFVFHRFLAQLRLDGGLSNIGRDNFLKVRESAFEEIPAVLSGWFGDPGNLILDFGYVGAPVASLITGWLVGWLYGSLCRSGVVINATATSVFAMAMLLTPSVNIFGLFLSNSINFFVLLLYLLTQKSALPKKISGHPVRVIQQNTRLYGEIDKR